jgi:hypothetical protein
MPVAEPLSRPAPTLARRIAVALVALVAAAQIVSSQLGTVAVLAQQPRFALGLPNAHARPMALMAWDLASNGGSRRQAMALAALANRETPLIEPAYAAIARDPAYAGGDWLDHAWQLSRRDAWAAQARFARAHARHDSADELAALAAALDLQFDPGTMRETYLADMASPATFAQALAAMRRAPHWRPGFFAGLHGDAAQQPQLVALIAALRARGAPLSVAEMAGLLGPISYGPGADQPRAFAIWRAWLGNDDPWAWPAADAAAHLPFDWVLSDRARIDQRNGAAVLAFSGNDNPALPLASKPMPVAAGRYRFVAQPGPGLAASAISAIVLCDGQTVALANGATWVADHACRSGELRLLVRAGEASVTSAALRPQAGG